MQGMKGFHFNLDLNSDDGSEGVMVCNALTFSLPVDNFNFLDYYWSKNLYGTLCLCPLFIKRRPQTFPSSIALRLLFYKYIHVTL